MLFKTWPGWLLAICCIVLFVVSIELAGSAKELLFEGAKCDPAPAASSFIGPTLLALLADEDGDGVEDGVDNCPSTPNPGQEDTDDDDKGDVCDNCPYEANPDQADLDDDTLGDECDNCSMKYNPDQSDFDDDTLGDACDNCSLEYNPDQADQDADLVGNVCDNCPDKYNPDQVDLNENGVGDACEEADLSVQIFDEPDPISVGETLTWNVVVANEGPYAAADMLLAFTLPVGVTFRDAEGSGWGCSGAGGAATCTRFEMPAHETSEIRIYGFVEENAPVQLIALAQIFGSRPDPNQSNNTFSEQTTLRALPDLTVTLTNNAPNGVKVGDTFEWTFTVTNRGQGNASFESGEYIFQANLYPDSDVRLIRSQAGLSSGISGGGTFACGSIYPSLYVHEMRCTAVDVAGPSGGDKYQIAPGGFFQVMLEMRLDAPLANLNVPPGSGGICQVDPHGLEREINEGNNDCQNQLAVLLPDLVVSLSSSRGTVSPRELWTWTLAVENHGTVPAFFYDRQIVLVDDLPSANTFYSGVQVSQSGLRGGAINCALNTSPGIASLNCFASTGTNGLEVAPGSGFTVSFAAGASAPGTYRNPMPPGSCQVFVGSGFESDYSNNDCQSNSVLVLGQLDLGLRIEGPDEIFELDKPFQSKATVQNFSESPINDILLSGVLSTGPDSLRLIEADGPGWECQISAQRAYFCTFSDELAPGGSADLFLTLAPNPANENGLARIDLWGEVTTGQVLEELYLDTNPENNRSRWVPFGHGPIDLTIQGSASPDPVELNSPYSYQLTVSNTGPFDAENVKVTGTIQHKMFIPGLNPNIDPSFIEAELKAKNQANWSCKTINAQYTIGFQCNLSGPLPVNQLRFLTLPARAPIGQTTMILGGGSLQGVFQVTGDNEPSGNRGDNRVFVNTKLVEPRAAFLTLKVTAPENMQVSVPFEYIIDIENRGLSPAIVEILGTLASLDAKPQIKSVKGLACFQGNIWYRCTSNGLLNPSGKIQIIVTAKSDQVGKLVSSIVATPLSQTGNTPNGNSVSSYNNIFIHGDSDLGISLRDGLDPVAQGASFTYAATVTNLGPDKAVNVKLKVVWKPALVQFARQLTDTLRVSSFQSPHGWRCTSIGNPVQLYLVSDLIWECSINEVGTNGSQITFNMVAPTSWHGRSTATAEVSGSILENDLTNNTTHESTTFTPRTETVDIEIREGVVLGGNRKDIDLIVGATEGFNLEVKNNSNFDVGSVFVRFSICITSPCHALLIPVVPTASGWTCSFSTLYVLCRKLSLGKNTTETLRVAVTGSSDSHGLATTLDIEAWLQGAGFINDPKPSNNFFNAYIRVKP